MRRTPYQPSARADRSPAQEWLLLASYLESMAPVDTTAEALIARALAEGCGVVCAAYNEPMISAEWARAVFVEAKRKGLTTVLVSDGNTTPEALAFMRPVTDVTRAWSGPDSAHTAGLTSDEVNNIDIYKAARLATVNITSTVLRDLSPSYMPPICGMVACDSSMTNK